MLVKERKTSSRPASALCLLFVFHIFFLNYQQLGGAEKVQGEGLDPGAVDAQLSVDARALNAGENA